MYTIDQVKKMTVKEIDWYLETCLQEMREHNLRLNELTPHVNQIRALRNAQLVKEVPR